MGSEWITYTFMNPKMRTLLEKNVSESQKIFIDILNSTYLERVIEATKIIKNALNANNKILIIGNGGSSADAQHFAAELVGRFEKERTSISALALTTDSSIITSIGNDYGFEYIFSRQIEGIGKKDDVLIAISTSGNSQNIIMAAQRAKEIGLHVIGFCGMGCSKLNYCSDILLSVPSRHTARIQEMHEHTIHDICELLEYEVTR